MESVYCKLIAPAILAVTWCKTGIEVNVTPISSAGSDIRSCSVWCDPTCVVVGGSVKLWYLCILKRRRLGPSLKTRTVRYKVKSPGPKQ